MNMELHPRKALEIKTLHKKPAWEDTATEMAQNMNWTNTSHSTRVRDEVVSATSHSHISHL